MLALANERFAPALLCLAGAPAFAVQARQALVAWLQPGATDTPERQAEQLLGWVGAPAIGTVLVVAPFVEVLRMDAGAAAARVLLNWAPDPGRCVTVRIPGGARSASVSSSEPGAVSVARDGPDREVQVMLGRVAVLTLEP